MCVSLNVSTSKMVEDFKDLRVYQRALEGSMKIFELSKDWPKEEKYSLTDQIRRSSRSVCANIGEAWHKRLYEDHFVSKLSDASSEAAETIVWLDIAQNCEYLEPNQAKQFERSYREIIGGLVSMIDQSDKWCGPSGTVQEELATYEPPGSSSDSDRS